MNKPGKSGSGYFPACPAFILIGLSNSPFRGMSREEGFVSLKLWERMGEVFSIHFHQHYVFVNRTGFEDGIDSAVVLALLQRALGSEHIFALLMPYKLSSEESLTDGKDICEQLKIKYEIIDISPAVDSYFDRYPADNKVLIGNKCARERMSILYDFSSRKKALVAGTSNKSELLIGYSTIFGDSAAAFLPLGDLYKTQVFVLARHLDIPEKIVNKKPSADLWKTRPMRGKSASLIRKWMKFYIDWCVSGGRLGRLKRPGIQSSRLGGLNQ
jgi:hypothetical protein